MVETKFELKGHPYQIADTGDYDGHYEITNGIISICTKHDEEEQLLHIVEALNASGADFYMDDYAGSELSSIKSDPIISAAYDMYGALEEILKMEGAYNQDPLKHAENVLTNIEKIAKRVMAKARGESTNKPQG